MTTMLAVMTTVAMVTVSPVGAVLFSLLCLFVTFVCPAWLLWLQPFKKYDFWCVYKFYKLCNRFILSKATWSIWQCWSPFFSLSQTPAYTARSWIQGYITSTPSAFEVITVYINYLLITGFPQVMKSPEVGVSINQDLKSPEITEVLKSFEFWLCHLSGNPVISALHSMLV